MVNCLTGARKAALVFEGSSIGGMCQGWSWGLQQCSAAGFNRPHGHSRPQPGPCCCFQLQNILYPLKHPARLHRRLSSEMLTAKLLNFCLHLHQLLHTTAHHVAVAQWCMTCHSGMTTTSTSVAHCAHHRLHSSCKCLPTAKCGWSTFGLSTLTPHGIKCLAAKTFLTARCDACSC